MKKTIIVAAVLLLAANIFVLSLKENSVNRASLLASLFSPQKFATASDFEDEGLDMSGQRGLVSHVQSCASIPDDAYEMYVQLNSGKSSVLQGDFGASVYADVPIMKGLASLNANANMDWFGGWKKANSSDQFVRVTGYISVKNVTSITATECPGTNNRPCPNNLDMNPCQTLKDRTRARIFGRYN